MFGDQCSVDSFVFLSRKRPLVALTCGDNSIRIWDDSAGILLLTKRVWADSDAAIVVIETEETNSFLFTGDAEGYIRVLVCQALSLPYDGTLGVGYFASQGA